MKMCVFDVLAVFVSCLDSLKFHSYYFLVLFFSQRKKKAKDTCFAACLASVDMNTPPDPGEQHVLNKGWQQNKQDSKP